jgi:hypothetical protein
MAGLASFKDASLEDFILHSVWLTLTYFSRSQDWFIVFTHLVCHQHNPKPYLFKLYQKKHPYRAWFSIIDLDLFLKVTGQFSVILLCLSSTELMFLTFPCTSWPYMLSHTNTVMNDLDLFLKVTTTSLTQLVKIIPTAHLTWSNFPKGPSLQGPCSSLSVTDRDLFLKVTNTNHQSFLSRLLKYHPKLHPYRLLWGGIRVSWTHLVDEVLIDTVAQNLDRTVMLTV